MVSEILKMIETVDPADTEKLDEIDAMVAKIDGWVVEEGLPWAQYRKGASISIGPIEYTRSRDALKSIRPEGWRWLIIQEANPEHGDKWYASAAKGFSKTSKLLPTEELAELHAVLQALDYERKSK